MSIEENPLLLVAFLAYLTYPRLAKGPRRPQVAEDFCILMATSKLQKYTSKQLSIHFGGFTIRENNRPDWLITDRGERLELDFFIEEILIAIEVQGQQHFSYISHFHTKKEFQELLRRDKQKKIICESAGIKLFYVLSYADVHHVINQIYELLPEYTNFIPLSIQNKLRKHLRSIATHHEYNPDIANRAYNEIILICKENGIKMFNLLGFLCKKKKYRKMRQMIKNSPYKRLWT